MIAWKHDGIREAQKHEKDVVAYSGVDCLGRGVLFADALRAGGVFAGMGHGAWGMGAWGHGGMEEGRDGGMQTGLEVVPVGPITVYVQLYTVHGWQTLPECVLSICQPGLELRLRYGTGLRHGMRHFDKQQSASAECICRLQVDQRNEYRVRALGLA